MLRKFNQSITKTKNNDNYGIYINMHIITKQIYITVIRSREKSEITKIVGSSKGEEKEPGAQIKTVQWNGVDGSRL